MQNLTQLGVSFPFSYRVFIRKHDVGLRKERAIARRMKTKMEANQSLLLSMLSVAASANTLSNTITVLLEQIVERRHSITHGTGCICSP